jgi:predicted cation transporter
MGWLVSLLESIFTWTFGILTFAEHIPIIIFSAVICIGLLYWLMWQQKYNKQADADPNQLK